MNKENDYKNLIYFQNGSIGDFLMTIFFLENIYLNNNKIKLSVVVPKNKKLLLQFLEKYPYINIILANRRSFKGILGIFGLFKFAFSRNLVITAPTPGKLSLYIKIIAKKISFFSKSELVGFDDNQKINKFIYTKLLKYNTNIIYSDFLKKLIEELGFKIREETPKLKYKADVSILDKTELKKREYIVLHPFGSTKSRSILGSDLRNLIKKIKFEFRNKKIIITGSSFDLKENFKTLEDLDVLILAGKLNISEIATIIEKSQFYIGVDTGITHLACMIGVKAFVIPHHSTTLGWLPVYNEKTSIICNDLKNKKCPKNKFGVCYTNDIDFIFQEIVKNTSFLENKNAKK